MTKLNIKNEKSTRHPEALAEGSHKILHYIQNDKQEQGRSMVEMLGVLAVIGVLSVAGIAGYSMAMRNHRANEVLNAASMLYVTAMAKNQGTGADTNYATEIGTPPSGTTLNYTVSDKKITITFPNSEDCTMAANKLGDKATADCANKTITVNFGGETIAENIPEPNSECTQEGAVICSDILDTNFTTEPAHKLLVCGDSYYPNGSSRLEWKADSVYCDGTCKDHQVHNSESAACNGTLVYPA